MEWKRLYDNPIVGFLSWAFSGFAKKATTEMANDLLWSEYVSNLDNNTLMMIAATLIIIAAITAFAISRCNRQRVVVNNTIGISDLIDVVELAKRRQRDSPTLNPYNINTQSYDTTINGADSSIRKRSADP
jgi:hypothetical protein